MKKLVFALLMSCGFALTAQAQYDPFGGVLKAGDNAPELAFPNPKGDILKLSEITKGRVTLVDFWASWCRPCRMANPRVVAMYDKYKDEKFKTAKNGFTILSVSLDKNNAAWAKAIEDDKLAWPFHMSDLGGWESEAAKIYSVQFVPQAMLIGPDGKIIATYQTAEQAEADLEKLVKK
jgi:thiol-disulfide isomerase/thioredoxin